MLIDVAFGTCTKGRSATKENVLVLELLGIRIGGTSLKLSILIEFSSTLGDEPWVVDCEFGDIGLLCDLVLILFFSSK